VSPTISGVVRVGSALTCRPGTWTNAPTFKYQWLRNNVPISGATSTRYVVSTLDYTKFVACRVTATNAGGSVVATTASFKAALGVIVNTKSPAISGTARVGNTLTALRGSWSPTPSAYTYQWFRNGVAIRFATKSTYKVVSTDRSRNLTVRVTAKRSFYANAAKFSAAKRAF
jgi:hypothetical protein